MTRRGRHQSIFDLRPDISRYRPRMRDRLSLGRLVLGAVMLVGSAAVATHTVGYDQSTQTLYYDINNRHKAEQDLKRQTQKLQSGVAAKLKGQTSGKSAVQMPFTEAKFATNAIAALKIQTSPSCPSDKSDRVFLDVADATSLLCVDLSKVAQEGNAVTVPITTKDYGGTIDANITIAQASLGDCAIYRDTYTHYIQGLAENTGTIPNGRTIRVVIDGPSGTPLTCNPH